MVEGTGKPEKVGRGGPGDPASFSGGGGNVKITADSGSDGEGKDGDGDVPGGGGGGKSVNGDDDPTSSSASAGERLKHDLTRYTQGKGDKLADADDKDADAPPVGKS